MKKIIVCGDSFMSPRTLYPGTHFVEIFSKHFEYELIVYARSAMSNGGIALQIQQAIKDKPDLIFFNTTQSDRIEFPIDSNKNFNGNLSINDIQYKSYGSTELSTQKFTFDGNLISDNLVSLLSNPDHYIKNHKLDQKKLEAIKLYFEEVYCERWKYQIDCMIMYHSIHKLHLSNIPYIWVHDYLHINEPYNLFWVDDKNNVTEKIHYYRSMPLPKNYVDPGFHTPFNVQTQIAEFLIEHYNKYFSTV